MLDVKAAYTELRKPLLLGGALLLVLLILALVAGVFSARMERETHAAQQQLRASEQRYRATLDAEQILRNDALLYERLREQGFVGAERRLDWVESLRTAATMAGVAAIRYELEPRRLHGEMQPMGSNQLFVSPMRLVLDLRHEGDLIRFIGLLEARAGGLFEVNSCSMRRARDESGIRLDEPNVTADCAFLWYSLDTPEPMRYEGM
jgi:hypothetical protein